MSPIAVSSMLYMIFMNMLSQVFATILFQKSTCQIPYENEIFVLFRYRIYLPSIWLCYGNFEMKMNSNYKNCISIELWYECKCVFCSVNTVQCKNRYSMIYGDYIEIVTRSREISNLRDLCSLLRNVCSLHFVMINTPISWMFMSKTISFEPRM